MTVASVGVFLNTGLGGIVRRDLLFGFGDEPIHDFHWWQIGLPALSAEEFAIRHPNNPWPLALMGLMQHQPLHRAQQTAEGLRKLLAMPSLDLRAKFLFMECLQAYMIRNTADRVDLREMLSQPAYRGVAVMVPTLYEERLIQQWEDGREKGLKAGRDEGLKAGQVALLTQQLTRRFGALTEVSVTRLNAMSSPELLDLGERLLTAQSLAELNLLSRT